MNTVLRYKDYTVLYLNFLKGKFSTLCKNPLYFSDSKWPLYLQQPYPIPQLLFLALQDGVQLPVDQFLDRGGVHLVAVHLAQLKEKSLMMNLWKAVSKKPQSNESM